MFSPHTRPTVCQTADAAPSLTQRCRQHNDLSVGKARSHVQPIATVATMRHCIWRAHLLCTLHTYCHCICQSAVELVCFVASAGIHGNAQYSRRAPSPKSQLSCLWSPCAAKNHLARGTCAPDILMLATLKVQQETMIPGAHHQRTGTHPGQAYSVCSALNMMPLSFPCRTGKPCGSGVSNGARWPPRKAQRPRKQAARARA